MLRCKPLLGLVALGATACDSNSGNDDSGNGNDDSGSAGIQLISAQLGPAGAEEFSTLILTFSDPVAPLDGVEPTDFRISFGLSFSYSDAGETVEQSAYYEPASRFGSYYPIVLTAIANGPGENQISITLEPPIDYVICTSVANAIESTAEFQGEGGLYPHYAPGTTPVTNTAGEELAAIGADWVLSGADDPPYYGYELFIEEAGFPNLMPRIPIPCPL